MTVIAISGMPGCGSSTTARLLAEKMNLKFFSAGDYTKELAKEEAKIDKNQTERIIDFWKTKRGQSKDHHMAVEELQQNIAKDGNIVIESKLGIHFIRNSDFKIWLKAPFKTRAERYVKRDGFHLEKAIGFLREKENSERANWKRIYGIDPFDQEKEADLVIDTSDKSPEEIVDIIIKAVRNKK
ncbi:MAG: cytidylate kinase family protein [Candidatus Aenigmarchaeota archaeon]|nr:cytidylate kinase family protein [Candidatus Aenigmarchaeota archaeon]